MTLLDYVLLFQEFNVISMSVRNNITFIHFIFASYHKHFLVAFVDCVVVDHAYDGHTEVAADTKRDAEPQARQDGDDVPPGETEAGTVHHGHFLLLHQLRAALCRQLNGFSIWLAFLDQP